MRKGMSIGLIIILLIGTLVLYAPSKSVEADGFGDYPPPAVGDWTINTDTYVGNETIILNGSLFIELGATLTFRNVTLIMNCTSDGEFLIEVKNGSSFYIFDLDNDNTTTYDASNITAYDPGFEYEFKVRKWANFSMENSELHECGYGPFLWQDNYGLFIESSNATIDHCYISNNYYGIVLYGSDAIVSNNSIEWNDNTGVYAGYYSNGTIENNMIISSDVYGIWVSGGSNSNPKPSNPLIINNTIIDTGRGLGGGVGIQITVSCSPLIKDCKILGSDEDQIYMWYMCNPTIINTMIDAQGGNYGIVGGGSWNWLNITNSSVSNAVVDDLFLGQSYFIFTNTTANFSNIWFADATSNLTINWFLNTYVNDTLGNPISNANVRVRDNANWTYDKNFTTDANGYLNWTVLREYNETQSTLIDYNPYNITVEKNGYYTNYTLVEMNETKSITVILEPMTPAEENLTLKFGWNLISFPVLQPKLNGTPIIRASDIVNVTGSIEVAIWNATGQNYSIYLPAIHDPWDPENFLIGEDDAIFVWMDDNATYLVEGYEPNSRNVTLKTGWNMVAYKNTSVGDVGILWAPQVSAGVYDDICWYDGQTFRHYIYPGTEMVLVPTRGYFVWSDFDTWLNY